MDLVGREVLSFRRRGPGRELDLGLLAARREEALEGASPVAGLGDALPRLLGPSGAPAPPPCSVQMRTTSSPYFSRFVGPMPATRPKPRRTWAWRRRWRRSSCYQTRRRPACRRRRACGRRRACRAATSCFWLLWLAWLCLAINRSGGARASSGSEEWQVRAAQQHLNRRQAEREACARRAFSIERSSGM